MEKLFAFDVETTGVDSKVNAIHQLSGAVIIDGKIVEHFDFKVRPHTDAVIVPQALEVGGVTLEQINAYPPALDVYQRLITLLGKYVDKFNKADKFHLLGYNNAPFDNQFLRAFFTRLNDRYFGSWFWSDSIDVMCLASNHLRAKRSTMLNFKQFTVAKQLGITVDENKLHNAEYDTQLLLQIYSIVK